MWDKFKGEISIILSAGLMGFSAVWIKYLSASFTGIQISFFRFLVGLLLGVPIALWIFKQKQLYDKKNLFLRGLTGSIAMIMYYMAIDISSSGRAHLILMVFPAFTALYGWLFFKEQISWKQIVSIVLCFGGVALVRFDGSDYPLSGDLLALGAAAVSGLAIHYVKKAREKNNALISYLAACVVGIVFAGGMFPAQGIPDFHPQMLWGAAGIGAVVFVAKIIEMYGFKFVSATSGSIITYISVPLVLLLSYVWIGEDLMPRLWMGMGLIMTGLVFNLWVKKSQV